MTNLALRLDWEIGNMTLTSISGYSDFQREESNDWDGGFTTTPAISTQRIYRCSARRFVCPAKLIV